MSDVALTDTPPAGDTLRLLAQADERAAAGDAEGALAMFAASRDGPGGAYAELRCGQILHARGDLAGARAALLRADARKAGDAPILFALAVVARDAGDAVEAEAFLRAAIRARPDAPESSATLVRLLQHQGRMREACDLVTDALRRCRPNAHLFETYGLLALVLGQAREAETGFRRALALSPEEPGLQVNLAEALADQQRWAECLDILDGAILRLGEPAQARLNRAYALFELERWREGWLAYEHRFARPAMAMAPRRPEHFVLPRWDGGPLAGPLFVWSEQGLGDEILAGSLLPALLARGIEVVFECSPRLAALFARSHPALTVIGRPPFPGAPPAACAAQIAAGSLFGLLDWSPATAPPAAAFLRADPARVAAARARLRTPGRRLVGISWASSNAQLGAMKTLPRARLQEILAGAGADTVFLDLQYGDSSAMRAALVAATGAEIRRDHETDVKQDIDGLAALVAACDRVVTASNVTAHVAGALGVETHVLVPRGRARLWYWLGAARSSPVYPGVTIHRQSPDGDWRDAVAAVRAALTRPIR